MKLVTRVPHKAGSVFTLKGERYQIDERCCVEVENEEHIKLLLRNTNWSEFGKRSPVVAKPVKGGFALIGKNGEVLGKEDLPTPPEESATSEEDKESEEVIDPPVPEGDVEWADPDPKYSKEWLIKCAKAYGVSRPSKKWSNEKLVEKILESMYE